MMDGTTNLHLLVRYYEHLVSKVEQEPKTGAELIYKLGLWKNIANTPFDKIASS